jgi:hypothetical protein
MNKPTCEPPFELINELMFEQMNDWKNIQIKTLQIYIYSQICTWQFLPKHSPEEGDFTDDNSSIPSEGVTFLQPESQPVRQVLFANIFVMMISQQI